MSSRLPMKRFSRSASSTIVPSSASLRRPRPGSRRCDRRLVADPRIEASGVRRSCEIEVSRAERSRSVSACSRARCRSRARLTRSIASAAWSVSASSSRCWSGVSSGAGLVADDADHAHRAAAGAHRQEQPFRARQRVGTAAGGVVLLPATICAAARSASSSMSSGGKPARTVDAYRPRAAAARRAPSASARSGARSPTAGRPACTATASLRLN